MKLIKLVVMVLGALVVGMCGLGLALRSKSPPASVPTQAMVPVLPPAPKPVSATSVLATFVGGDVLDECLEVTFTAPPGTASDVVTGKLNKLSEAQLSEQVKGREMAALKVLCAEQFKDRPALGTCRASKNLEGEPKIAASFVSFAYNVNSLDGYMKDCLKRQGDWTAADKDTLVVERIHQRAASTRKLVDKLANEDLTPP